MNDFLSPAEVASLGLAACGQGVQISRLAQLYFPATLSLGDHSRIDAFAIISASAPVHIGRNVHISAQAVIMGKAPITIGDFCSVSVRAIIFSTLDDLTGAYLVNPTFPAAYRNERSAPVVLGKHAVVSAGATVLPGVTIGEAGLVAAHAVAMTDVGPFAIVGGVPARPISTRQRGLLDAEAQYLAGAPAPLRSGA